MRFHQPEVYQAQRDIDSDRANSSDSWSNAKWNLRNIALIGHSVKEDLKVIQFLGLDAFQIAPVTGFIDIYLMARYILPLFDAKTPLGPDQHFSLAAVLSQLGCSPDPVQFHNAGNDAVYTLYAMLLLAIKESTNRIPEMTCAELCRLDTLRPLVFDALDKAEFAKFQHPPAVPWASRRKMVRWTAERKGSAWSRRTERPEKRRRED
jgi:hypothetical protein